MLTKISASGLSDWQRTSNNTSKSSELAHPSQVFTSLCNLSPFNPFYSLDPSEFQLLPTRKLPEAPGQPFQARCNFTPANPYVLPTMVQGQHGVTTWQQKPDYTTYKSPYGPNYNVRPNFHGINLSRAMKFGITAGSFGVVGMVFALQFFSDVPKVRTDILQKIPVIGDHFVKEIPPSDNPF